MVRRSVRECHALQCWLRDWKPDLQPQNGRDTQRIFELRRARSMGEIRRYEMLGVQFEPTIVELVEDACQWLTV